jgi:maleate isomerase
MADTLGSRMKVGVIAPASNTVVQPEFDRMRPRGVTNQQTRVNIPDTPVGSEEELAAVTAKIRADIEAAVDTAMACMPAAVVMAFGAETLWEGLLTPKELQAQLEHRAGVHVVLSGMATIAAMQKYGGVRRIGVLTPYLSAGDAQVRRFFTDAGFEVVNLLGLRSASPALMAHEPLEKLRRATRDVDDQSIELIVQVGSNLPFAQVAADAERWLSKPVLAANTCCYWQALRQFGIDEKVEGFGSLLAEY